MRAEHYHETSLKVRVPRGNAGFWEIICKLHRAQGDFTVADIDGESNVNVKMIQKYVRLLIAGGFVERVGRKDRPAKRFEASRFRLLKSPNRAPRVRADGSGIADAAIGNLWTAIRGIKSFGLRELMFTAATDDVKPSYALTKRYVCYLTTAGYLTVVLSAVGSKPATWRLKPGMDTGPLPPCLKALRADAMYDPNLKAFVGAPALASEVAP
jgi:hypothetical protein